EVTHHLVRGPRPRPLVSGQPSGGEPGEHGPQGFRGASEDRAAVVDREVHDIHLTWRARRRFRPQDCAPVVMGMSNGIRGSTDLLPPNREEHVVMLAFIAATGCGGGVTTLLWIVAVVLVIAGIVSLIRGGIIAGIVLIIVGLLIGPGGVSIFC